MRCRAASSSIEASPISIHRDLIPTNLAAAIWSCINSYRTTIPNFPKKETCELLIVDRTIDQASINDLYVHFKVKKKSRKNSSTLTFLISHVI